jgi:uncharacterized membrane protein
MKKYEFLVVASYILLLASSLVLVIGAVLIVCDKPSIIKLPIVGAIVLINLFLHNFAKNKSCDERRKNKQSGGSQ